MNEQQALAKMIPPGKVRSGKWRGGVIQIWVTRACDKSCFGCTQGSNLAGRPVMITVEQFRNACLSLKGYFGVVGMFGGNPAMHPDFDALCDVMKETIPAEQRGLWCNNPLGHGKKMRETFNPIYSNLNVHLDRRAFEEFKRDWPESRPCGLETDSRHSPPYVAMLDVVPSEEERWRLISTCDINRHWSAMICVFRGQLRAYFCEVAGAQAMLHQWDESWPDLGHPVEEGWWKKSMREFQEQVRFHCHRCGIPLRGHGELAQAASGLEQTSETHQDIYNPKRPNRSLQIVHSREELGERRLLNIVDYLGNSER